MRLIDADAMKEWIDEYVSVFKKYDKGTIKGFVDHAPTIEPKRGKWIGTRIGHYPGYECSLCHYGVQPWNNTNFCPNWGADMREREGE